MAPPPVSPLYKAVVLAGVALMQGALAACSSDESSTENVADAGADAAKDAASEASADSAAAEGDACPPGSERPVPPCALIL